MFNFLTLMGVMLHMNVLLSRALVWYSQGPSKTTVLVCDVKTKRATGFVLWQD